MIADNKKEGLALLPDGCRSPSFQFHGAWRCYPTAAGRSVSGFIIYFHFR